jgi:hypothetical protein
VLTSIKISRSPLGFVNVVDVCRVNSCLNSRHSSQPAFSRVDNIVSTITQPVSIFDAQSVNMWTQRRRRRRRRRQRVGRSLAIKRNCATSRTHFRASLVDSSLFRLVILANGAGVCGVHGLREAHSRVRALHSLRTSSAK